MPYGNSYNRNTVSAQQPQFTPVAPADLPADFVDEAENVIKNLGTVNTRDNSKLHFKITTSKIRRLLSLITPVLDRELRNSKDTLCKDTQQTLMMARVRIAYEAGRDPDTGHFVRQAKLISYLKGIGTSREKFINFAQYLEALVAWHRYYSDRKD